ncbi:Domain of uncharacterised function (DUF2825) [Klebsiella variicola]|nr:Domain of uncharacterised function (DUF2825) [Klebsiella variicola]
MLVSSPRTWGCFRSARRQIPPIPVFPTHVGVFLDRAVNRYPRKRLPHARGGVSIEGRVLAWLAGSSPRTWGCFPYLDNYYQIGIVFPTHVGVFLNQRIIAVILASLPHARGGVSIYGQCRVFPDLSSPRTWGCFHRYGRLYLIHRVFPTHVGVFPGLTCVVVGRQRLPRACGVFP